MGLFKNEVGRPSNETIKKRNIFKGICFVLVLIIIGLVVLLLNEKGIININGGNRQSNDNTNVKANEKTEDLDVNSDEVKNLFNTFDIFNSNYDLLSSDGKNELYSYFYQKDKVESSEVSDEIKFAYSFINQYKDVSKIYESDDFDFREKSISSFSGKVSDVNEKSKILFGSEFDINSIKDKMPAVFGLKPIINNDDIKVETAGIGGATGTIVKTKITSAQKKNDEITITNKVMFIYQDDMNNSAVYKTALSEIKQDELMNNNWVDLSDRIDKFATPQDINTIKIDDYLDKLDSFKWTFVKDKDGNYTFKSVEKVNN